MFRNTTATPFPSQSIRHTTSEGSVSAPAQTAVGQTSITQSKISGLSAKVLQEIREIANASIQNKEKIDSLAHFIHLANLKIRVLEEKKPHSQTENTRKADLRKDISSTAQEEETVKKDISDLSIRIQSIEKKRQQQTQVAARRAADFQKHFITFDTFKKDKEVLDAEKSALSIKDQTLQNCIDEKMAEIRQLRDKMAPIDASIKKALDGEIGKNYEEMLQSAELLLKRHGLQLPSENTMEELIRFLHAITDHPMAIGDQINHLEKERDNKNNRALMAAGTAAIVAIIAVFMKVAPVAWKFYMPDPEDENIRELVRLGQPIKVKDWIRFQERRAFATAAQEQLPNQAIALTAFLVVVAGLYGIYRLWQQRSLEKEKTRIAARAISDSKPLQRILLKKRMADSVKSEEEIFLVETRAGREIIDNKPLQRTLKKGIADSAKSKEEELFKLAFGLAKRANIKLIKSPLETMTKEVTRLVMEAEMRGETSINADAVDAGKISEYLTRFKSVLGREVDRLEKKLDRGINEYLTRKDKKGENYDKNQLSDLLKIADVWQKSDFVKKFIVNNEEKAIGEIADKAMFMNEFSKIFNGSNEESFAIAFRHIIVNMAQDMLDKLAATDAGSVGAGASSSSGLSSFEERIKNIKQDKFTLKETLRQANAELEETDQENKKIKKDIQDVSEEIKVKNDGMSEAMGSMKVIPLSQSQKEEFELQLREASIDIELRDEYAGQTDKKISHLKAQRVNEESFAELLKTHDELCNKYSALQKKRMEQEDELAKIEFLEADRTDEKSQIKKIQDDIKTYQKEIAKLESEEKNLLSGIENIPSLREVLTLKAIRRVRDRHLAQSESDLQSHAQKNGYSSNYLSVGHFLKACLDAHASLQQKIEATGKADLYSHFAKSDMDVADGMNQNFQHRPISASVADFCMEGSDQDGKIKYLISHIYGYVPRGKASVSEL